MIHARVQRFSIHARPGAPVATPHPAILDDVVTERGALTVTLRFVNVPADDAVLVVRGVSRALGRVGTPFAKGEPFAVASGTVDGAMVRLDCEGAERLAPVALGAGVAVAAALGMALLPRSRGRSIRR